MLRPIVSYLDAESSKDALLAAVITSRLVHMLKKPKKYGLAQASVLYSPLLNETDDLDDQHAWSMD